MKLLKPFLHHNWFLSILIGGVSKPLFKKLTLFPFDVCGVGKAPNKLMVRINEGVIMKIYKRALIKKKIKRANLRRIKLELVYNGDYLKD